MHEIKIDKLVRSKRRTIALIVASDATLVVRAPLQTPLELIQNFIFEKRQWIQKQKLRLLKNGGLPKKKEFISGETFLFLGETYKLNLADCWDIELSGTDLNFPQRFFAKARPKMIAWYKEQAFEKITEMANHYSRISGWKFKTINITSANRRWGSCSWTGSINFSWRLIMAPRDVVEYVVVHELAHITEKNHSKKFWSKVESILPHYRIQEKWLKENGKNLTI